MTALEQIQQLPLHDKLMVMEAIWNDLARREDQVEVPEWHKDILDEREGLLREGKARFIEWEEAKREIKEVLS